MGVHTFSLSFRYNNLANIRDFSFAGKGPQYRYFRYYPRNKQFNVAGNGH